MYNSLQHIPNALSGNLATLPLSSGPGADFGHKVRVMVILRKTYGGNEEYKKMMIVVNAAEKIYSLKRAIEREFLDLFPNEPPYVVAKLEDATGFSLSNGSNIGDFIGNGQVVYAQPEVVQDPRQRGGDSADMVVHGGSQNPLELLQMMQSLQRSTLHKLATNFPSYLSQGKELASDEIGLVLRTILPMGFTTNRQDLANVSLLVNKSLQTVE